MKSLRTQRLQGRFVCAHSALSAYSVVNHSTRDSRLATRGLTLVELLVVVVILTTLVAGVVPVLSPNNDARKIREAGRGLQTYITLTQARAARTGRPQGIAFRESSPGSGVALEVFGLEVPPPFAGFSTESRVTVEPRIINLLGTDTHVRYNPGASTSFDFHPIYNGFFLYNLRFVLADGSNTLDPFPPRMFRIGDVIQVAGNQFLVVDDNQPNQQPNQIVEVNGVEYLVPDTSAMPTPTVCVWLNDSGQVAPQGLKTYQITRQPRNSAAEPFQLPAGIAIDMQASVAEGNQNANRGPSDASLFTELTARANPTADFDSVGIMFSPTGAVSSVLHNGSELTSVSRLVLLLGRIENGGLTGNEWVMDNNPNNDQSEVEQLQRDINWLNLDSRLLSIVTQNGRTVVSETAFVDPSLAVHIGADATETAELQIDAAQAFARELTTAR